MESLEQFEAQFADDPETQALIGQLPPAREWPFNKLGEDAIGIVVGRDHESLSRNNDPDYPTE